MPFKKFIRYWIAVTLGFGAVLHAAEEPSREQIDFFETHIRPLLIENCFDCHSAEKKVKGGLRLDLRAGWAEGGDSGPAIVPGQPDQSLLIRAVRYHDEDLQMPPKDKKLPDEKIALLEQWIAMGAPDPRDGELGDEHAGTGAADHWSFQPVQKPEVPETIQHDWARNEIDAFILAAQKERGLSPSPDAEPRTLIRRAYYDLIGLPPTPEAVEAFESDPSDQAYAALIEDLLSRPEYGERWARHWLDVARYSDTKGYVFEEERNYPFAYTYRDYVIESFNNDKPFDRFILEQIAADKLELGDDKSALAAMGYLTLGRRFLNNQHDIIDDRIDVVTRGFLGLTVACARCHDHKYDPIPTEDYYSLYGVFNSSREPDEKPLLGTKPPQYDAYLEEHNKRVRERDEYIANTDSEILRNLKLSAGAYLQAAHEGAEIEDREEFEKFVRARNLNSGVVRRWQVAMQKWKENKSPIFVPWFHIVTGDTNAVLDRYNTLVEAVWNDELEVHPIIWAALTNNPPSTVGDVAHRYDRVFEDIVKEWEAMESEADAFEDADRESLRLVLYENDSPVNISGGALRRMYNVEQAQKSRALQRKVEELDANHPGAPPRAMVMYDKDQPEEPKVFIRGQPGRPGDPVPRRFLKVLAGEDRKPFDDGSGRLELARAIADESNPLTARVLVNRVWSQYFNARFVETASDFGTRADPPSHPELLDYLASHLMDSGWSMKSLHRKILLSSTYRQSSFSDPEKRAVDPGNRYYWRQNRKRLDFEAMRDTLLALAGNLNPERGGQAVDIVGDDYRPRRSIYGYIDRQNLPAMFRTFDLASPDTHAPRRFETTVPQQALFLMNSPFIARQTRLAAERLSPESKPVEAAVREAFELVYQREPTPGELQIGSAFLEQAKQSAPPEPEPPVWQYGYGSVDESGTCVNSFTPLEHFKDGQYQVSGQLPDPEHGWVMLNREGGHPGNDHQHAAIRRWVAPMDGVVDLNGSFKHNSGEGDGVQARVLATGAVNQATAWVAFHGEVKTSVESIKVRQGDIIDFVVDCRSGPNHDSFQWEVEIEYTEVAGGTDGSGGEYKSAAMFAAPEKQEQPLEAWDQFVQMLLVSNETFFID